MMWLRLSTIGIIALLVTVRLGAAGDYRHDVLKGAHDTLVEAGLEILPSTRMWDENYGAVRVRPPDCDHDVAVMPFPIMIDTAAMRQAIKVDEEAGRIIYFDTQWDTQVKTGLFLSLIRQRMRHALGTSDLYPSGNALLLSGSAECLATFPVDMAAAWRIRS